MITYTIHYKDEEYHFTSNDVIDTGWYRDEYAWLVKLKTGISLEVSSKMCNSISLQIEKKSKKFRIRVYLLKKDRRRIGVNYDVFNGLRNVYINAWFWQTVIGESRKNGDK